MRRNSSTSIRKVLGALAFAGLLIFVGKVLIPQAIQNDQGAQEVERVMGELPVTADPPAEDRE